MESVLMVAVAIVANLSCPPTLQNVPNRLHSYVGRTSKEHLYILRRHVDGLAGVVVVDLLRYFVDAVIIADSGVSFRGLYTNHLVNHFGGCEFSQNASEFRDRERR